MAGDARNHQGMAENYYTTRDAAKLLGVSVRTVQQWVDKGDLASWKTTGGHRRVMRNSVLRMVKEDQRIVADSIEKASVPVLIIEDDEALLKLYRMQLSNWSFNVTIYTAPNGFEGLVMLGEVAPRLLICDLRLPGVNGFQIVRTLSTMQKFEKLAIVVVSGMAPEEITAYGGVPPGVELMSKPIDFKRLSEIAKGLR
ncbi:MAG: response regulator [Proteobacteria bacterium]|nr:response regulator [Pseudomonadota bacterium]